MKLLRGYAALLIAGAMAGCALQTPMNDEPEVLQVIPGGKADADMPIVDSLAPHVLGPGFAIFRLARRARPRLRVLAQKMPVLVWAWSKQWRYLGRFSSTSSVVDADGASYLAVTALGDGAQVSLELLPDPKLVLRRVFDRVEEEATVAAGGATPGARLSVLVEALNLVDGDSLPGDSGEVRAFLIDPDAPPELARTELDAGIHERAAIDGDRAVLDVHIPKNIEPSLRQLQVSWGALVSQPVDIEITTSAMAARRDAMADLARQVMYEYNQQDLSLIGGYRPLPANALLCAGLDNTVETVIESEGTWLFYAFDPDEGFAQSRSAWLLLDEETHALRKLDLDVWPRVRVDAPGDPAMGSDGVTCGGSAFGPDFGNYDNHRDQYFNADEIADRIHTVPRKRARVPVTPPFKRIPRTGPPPPRLGKSYTGLVKAGCRKVTKVALLIQFDDNTAATTEDGRQIPSFDDLLADEARLINELGFDAVKKLGPDDFLRDSDFGSTGRPKTTITSTKLLRRIKESIAAVVAGFSDPCCTELLVIFNSHQKHNDVKYRNRDIPFKGWPGKIAKKMTKGIVPVDSLALAVSEAVRVANPMNTRCPAAQLIIHSCYSGHLAGAKLTKARENGLGIITSSSSTETTKGKRRGDDTSYYLIEALRRCAAKHPNKTLADAAMWSCVMATTATLSKGTQTPRKHTPKWQ